MSALESVCEASNALADLVLRYQDLREKGDSFGAARTRKAMIDAAHGAKACADSARALGEAVRHDLSATPWGLIPNAARGRPVLLPPANTNETPSEPGPSIA